MPANTTEDASSPDNARRRVNIAQIPPFLWIDRAGGVVALAIRCLVELVTPGLSWRREFTIQCGNIFTLAAWSVFMIAFLVTFAIVGVEGGATLEAFGAADRVGAFVPFVVLGTAGPLIAGAVMSGVIGTTITAEIGARKLREELDALIVMGIDPIRNLVLPRIVALTATMIPLNMVAFAGGVLGAFAGAVGVLQVHAASFWTQMLANTSYVSLWASFIEVLIIGFAIGTISCFKGLASSGGAEGVGRAVNESVVANLLGMGAIGLVFTALFLALDPGLLVLR